MTLLSRYGTRACTLTLLAVALGLSARANADCDPTTCGARDTSTACGTRTWGCVTESCQSLPIGGNASPNCSPLHICELVSSTNAPVNTACPDDGNPCTTDLCDGAGSCAHAAGNNGAGCPDDGNVCTSDLCSAGTCTHPAGNNGGACPDDGNVCTNDVCAGGACSHPANTATCPDDGNVCTSDVCSGGVCTHPNPSGGKVCGAACVAQSYCCNPATDCPAVPGGSPACSNGTCVPSCPGAMACGYACIPTTGCCSNANCSGGKTCTSNACSCPAGSYDCNGTCISNTTCCTAANCTAPSGATATCPTPGQPCVIACDSTHKSCNGTCIPTSACCMDTDCTGGATHQVGKCTATGCVYTCDPAYPKICNGACVATTYCCGAADCTTPPNSCYDTQGTCTSGACKYTPDDSNACDADSNKCTTDSCKSGTCMKGTQTFTCPDKDCYTNNNCAPSTGDCSYTALSTGTCGGNGCSSGKGTCSNGTCSVAARMDCNTTTACTVGLCDAKGPVGAPCISTNVTNGTACTPPDGNKCTLAAACENGACVGTAKVCTPSGPCRTSTCNKDTGSCEEVVSNQGSSCSIEGSCVQNASCDSNGNCVGDTAPDGNPCDKADCTLGASCDKGTCTCNSGTSDFGGGGIIVTEDAGTSKPKSKGCSTAPGVPGSALWLSPLLVLFALRRRARARVPRRR